MGVIAGLVTSKAFWALSFFGVIILYAAHAIALELIHRD